MQPLRVFLFFSSPVSFFFFFPSLFPPPVLVSPNAGQEGTGRKQGAHLKRVTNHLFPSHTRLLCVCVCTDIYTAYVYYY